MDNNINEGPQVFINFRGEELRANFMCHLVSALRRIGVNAFIGSDTVAGENLNILFKITKDSTVAVAIISSRYTESNWCLYELVKIIECVEQDNLRVIPIFYNLNPSTVKRLEGDFGVQLWDLWRRDRNNRDDRILKWNGALQNITERICLISQTRSNDAVFVSEIVTHVQNILTEALSKREETYEPHRRGNSKCWNMFLVMFFLLVTYFFMS